MRRRETYVFATDLNRRPVRGFFRRLLMTLLAILLLGALADLVMVSRVQLTSLRISVPELPADLEGYSILHFSDLHGQELGTAQQRIATAIGTQASSIAVFTGDMVGTEGNAQPLLDLAALLPANMPKLLILGDEDPDYLDASPHGSLSAYADWAAAAVDAGYTILDAPYLVARGTNGRARIWFIPEELYTLNLDNLEATYTAQLSGLTGTGDLTAAESARRRVAEYQLARVARIRQSLSEMRETDVQIVLTHAPLSSAYTGTIYAWSSRSDLFTLRRAALILAGHTCGGGFRLPLLGPVWSEDGGFFPGDEGLTGLSWVSGTPEYISPGLAMHHQNIWQPFRLFNTPTVTRLVLTSRSV